MMESSTSISCIANQCVRISILLLFYFCLFVNGIQITGAGGGNAYSTGTLPFRYEINQFASAGPSFDLFILSLAQIQSLDQSDPMSYFQIAGIHGFPQIPWDGVIGTGGYPGYCMHASTPFPTWHRPYIALYEQAIWKAAQIIAAQYPPDSRILYQNAASTLRVPYWDWVIYPYLPEVVIFPNISVNTPDGYQSIPNPLYSYKFQHDAAGNGFPIGDPMANFSSTVRWWNFTTHQSNQNTATQALMSNAPSILAVTYQLFSVISDYTSFSCTWPGGKSNSANNIENIHNSIHNSVGGWGHMQFPEVAAFDPIFWLHHTNVDRLFAIWQALNPTSYIVPTLNAYGSYYEVVGSIDSGNTSLAPFHSDNGTRMFTSDDVQETRKFGYTYPELPTSNMSTSALAANVRHSVNLLYNPDIGSQRKRQIPPSKQNHVHTKEAFEHITIKMAKDLCINNLQFQWNIRVKVNRFAFSTSFAIDFFMGEPPQVVTDWATAPNLIGSHAQFIPANVSIFHAYPYPVGMLQGEVSLTHTLAAGVDRGVISDLSPRSVIPILRKSLNWRARSPDGCEIDLQHLSGLSISVGSRPVVPATSTKEFPHYGNLEWHKYITRGKVGGSRH